MYTGLPFSEGCYVPVAGRAALDLGLAAFAVLRELDQLGQSDLTVLVATQMSHLGLLIMLTVDRRRGIGQRRDWTGLHFLPIQGRSF